MAREFMFGRVDREGPAQARQRLMSFIDESRKQWVETEELRIQQQQDARQQEMAEARFRALQQAVVGTTSPDQLPALQAVALDFVRTHPGSATMVSSLISDTAKRVAPEKRTTRETTEMVDGELMHTERVLDEQGNVIEVRPLRPVDEKTVKPSDRFHTILEGLTRDPEIRNLPIEDIYRKTMEILNTGRQRTQMDNEAERLMSFMTISEGDWKFLGDENQARDLMAILGARITEIGSKLRLVPEDQRDLYSNEYLTLQAQLDALYESLGIFQVKEKTGGGSGEKDKDGSRALEIVDNIARYVLGEGYENIRGIISGEPAPEKTKPEGTVPPQDEDGDTPLPADPPIPIRSEKDAAIDNDNPMLWHFRDTEGNWIPYEWLERKRIWTKRTSLMNQ
jgi:hypothetical protein